MSLAENQKRFAELVASGKIKPAPVTPTAYPSPDPEPGFNALSRGPLPPSMWTQPDATRQGHAPAIPQTRVLPTSLIANPVVGSQAATQATIIAAAAVAANNAASSSSGTDTDIIAGVNRQIFGGVDSFSQNSASSPTTSINSISITSFAAGANELAIVAAVGGNSAGELAGQNPGGWTALASQVGCFTKVIAAAGPLTVAQAFPSGSFEAAQTLLFLKSNGSTPVFTLRASQSGGTNLTSAPFTPGAGNTLLWTVVSNGVAVKPAPIVTDSVGLVWQLLANLYVVGGGGAPQDASIVQYIAQNVPATSMTVSLDLSAAIGGSGTWTLHEISNVNLGSGAYTFQTSDNLQLVEFGGGANVTATLQSPAFPAGWQCLAANNSIGNVTLTSAAYINNSSTPVVVGPGGFTWIFSDGSNYWVTATAAPSNAPKIAHQWLDSYNPLTGTFGQSQPAVGDLSTTKTGTGNIVLATSPTINTPTLLGSTLANTINVNNIFAKYNNIATVSNGVPAEYATVDNTTATANIGSTALYAVPTNGQYRLSYYVVVNRVATSSSTLPDLQFTWTDPDNSTLQTFGPVDSATPSANTLTTTYSGSVIVNAKGGTNINYQTGVTTAYASVGATSMQYSVHLKLEAM